MSEKSIDEQFAALSEEQKEKAAACKTPEEMTELLTEMGMELTDEYLDKVGGGQMVTSYASSPSWWTGHDNHLANLYSRVSPPKYPCPRCGSWDVSNFDRGIFWKMIVFCKCGYFGYRDGSDYK